MTTATLDSAQVREFVSNKAIRAAAIVGEPGGWSVRLRHGRADKALAAQRSGRVRLWRSLDRCVAYLKDELGIAVIDGIDARRYEPGVGGAKRPDRARALRRAHAAAGQLDHSLAQTERLAEYPKLGRPGRVRGTRELVIAHTPFFVAYRANVDAVTVLRLLHGAQQWPTSG